MVVPLKPVSVLFLNLIFLLEATLINVCIGNRVLCFQSEKQALLTFKQDLVDPLNRLSSWYSGNDCCKWAGIVCDNRTGHVIELHLDNGPFQGKLNPSLLSLTHLTHLDLSYNEFKGIKIPSFIGSLLSLKYLDLTESRFEGMIPDQLGNLSSLVHLDLGGTIGLYAKNLHWLSSLSLLEYLGMSYVNLSEASNHWLEEINMLPSLLELYFLGCDLSLIHSLSHVNFSSLTVLDISFNHFHAPIPSWVFSLTNLVSLQLVHSGFIGSFPNASWSLPSLIGLDVSSNNLSSTIPDPLYGIKSLENLNLGSNNLHGVISSTIGNLSSIVGLVLSDNALEGKLPASLGNLCKLEELGLSSNKLNGEVSEAFESLSGCLANSLQSLYLEDNLFSGEIPDQIGEFNNIAYLSLGSNMISGPIPLTIGKLSVLESLDISNNRLNGSLPESIGSLSNLGLLDISGNLLEGTLSEVHFANLTNLFVLDGSDNSLALRASSDWIPPFRLDLIRLRNWNLGLQFPSWLKSQKHFSVLDLSNTGLSDAIPNWFWNLSSTFLNMNLSHNQISGEIPDMLPVTGRPTIYLGSNKLKGPLPRIHSALTVLDLSNNLFSGDISRLLCKPMGVRNSLAILRLGKNLLSGEIPNCWMYWQSLEVIELGTNKLTGELPNSIGSLQSLQSLHLRNNILEGEIPFFLRNCTMLRVMDFGLNKLVGSIPKWIGIDLPKLKVFGARSNKLKGQIPHELCGLTALQVLDFADNSLSGTIPSCFNNFKAMATKPQSVEPIMVELFSFAQFLENAFVVTRGREDQYNTILTLLTSLDISQNNLSGEIPKQLTSLQGLLSLNLSGNHLIGSIPDTIGDMAWLQSLDLSMNQLSGRLPPSLSNLNFLSHLNVSYNNLSGGIPLSTQLQSVEPSSFIGNQLCGPPLPNDCSVGNKTTSAGGTEYGTGQDDEEEEYWFRLGIAIGFAVGFLGIISPLLLSTTWRSAYFWFVQHMWYKILDCSFHFKCAVRNQFSRSYG